MNGKKGMIIFYQFVVYIHGHVFSCIAAVLTNHSSYSSENIKFCGLLCVFDWQENLWEFYFHFHGHDFDYHIAKLNMKFSMPIILSLIGFSHML